MLASKGIDYATSMVSLVTAAENLRGIHFGSSGSLVNAKTKKQNKTPVPGERLLPSIPSLFLDGEALWPVQGSVLPVANIQVC